MPIYTFADTTKEPEEFMEITMKIAELDQFKLDNPHLQQRIVRPPSLGDSHRLGRQKPDDGFRDVLKNIKHHHKKDNINTW